MKNKQTGDITVIAILMLIIVVLGGIFLAERSSMRSEIKTLQTSLGAANANVDKLGTINAGLIEEVKTQKELAKVAQEEAKVHREAENRLDEKVKSLSKKLPSAQPRAPTDKVDQAQEERSLARITVLNETFCSLNPEQPQCIQPEKTE